MVYAQADTHFLLYIYDRMRNALLEKSNPTTHNLVHAALKRSADTCLNRYRKEAYDAEGGDGSLGWRNLYSKWSGSFNNTQFAVYKALHAWRDQMARDEDESTRYVLPNNMLFTLADQMPEEASKVLACCNPVPPLVRMNATDIALLIISTKANVVAPTLGKVRIAEADDSIHGRHDPTARDGTHPSSNLAGKTLEKSEQAQGQDATARSSRMFDGSSSKTHSGLSPVAVKTMTNPTKFIAARSGLFGDSSSQTKASKAEEEGKKIAQRIIIDLSAQQSATPVFKEITLKSGKITTVETTTTTITTTTTTTTTEPAVAGADQEEVLFVPKEERATKAKRTDVLVLSTMSKKRSRALDEDLAEVEKEAKEDASESEDAPAAMEEETVGDGGEGSDVVKVKKNKKNKKRKHGEAGTGSSTSSAAATPSSSAAASGSEEPESFKPFDYNSVRSVVDEVIDGAGSGKKRRKKKGSAGSSSEAPARKSSLCFCVLG